MFRNLKFFALAVFIMAGTAMYAQETAKMSNKKDGGYHFTVIKDIEATEVQNQGRTGTCWSFSSLSFFESELLRMKKGKHNLSEMYIARKAYEEKAANYVRMHGNFNFGPGGAFHDIPYVAKKFGLMPEEAYKGLNYGTDVHNHAEMDAILQAVVKEVVKNPQGKLTPAWKKAVSGILDAYLGEVPSDFTYNGKKYTPESFAKELGLDMDDYVLVTSFTHHPFYEQFVLEVPDNWALQSCYNVPLDEMMKIAEHAVSNGYGVAWASDVSEKGFSFRDGLAIVPEDESTIQVRGRDNSNFSDAGAQKVSSAFDAPVKEKNITQEMRQEGFDNYQTQDDHGMHFTGLVKDQIGTKYFIVKNSWGKGNDCDGYFYASEAYFKYKTTNIMLHKDGIPKDMRKKLGIK
jgi:bleomycin hydrolase